MEFASFTAGGCKYAGMEGTVRGARETASGWDLVGVLIIRINDIPPPRYVAGVLPG